MNRLTRMGLWFVLCLALGAVASGCGGSGAVKVTGKVTSGGQPLVSKTGHVQVTLIPAEPGANYSTYPASPANPDGTFEILNVPPGKYKVAVEQLDTPQSDALKGAFNAQKTKIIRDIDGSKPLDIDLAKET